MTHTSEYDIEMQFIKRLESIGYEFIKLNSYDDVLKNFRNQLCKFNGDKLIQAKGSASLSDKEFRRVLLHLDNKTVYESAKLLRDKYTLKLDNEETIYLEFFSYDTDRNIYQVSHQITMDKAHKDDIYYKNRYDVTVIINGLPLVQVELKRPGVEINEAINQINKYRKFSFKGLFRYLQLFVVSNSDQTKYFCNENEMENGLYNPIRKSLVFFWTDEKNKRSNKLGEFTAEFFRKAAITEMIDKYMIIKATEPVLMVMRPYQIYAVKAAKKRVLEANQNGYVFACTGSGKTLTSFKLAQLLEEEPLINKVIFLIDRKDLDDQTVSEYNSFKEGCVDNSDSTAVLVTQLKGTDRKLIVTTIQKMAHAIKSKRYEKIMDAYRDKKIVFIIDECHRSQFGKMHRDIERHFLKANYIGFTGTPIFEKNKGVGGRTTADVFNAGVFPNGEKRDACLHRYMIKDAIADGNVLKFSVEYQRTITPEQFDDPEYCKCNKIDIDSLYHDPKRIRKVVENILQHHKQHTYLGSHTYTALFAVDSIKSLGQYYDIFRELNGERPEAKRYKIAAIFSYGANEDMDGKGDEHSSELLERIMRDYNQMFGTSFTLEGFDAYRKDISKRLKQKDLPQVDILLVVNMMLTGFDAKPLNTLYLDKNLIHHNLIQAYSRTNRVDRETQQFGQIVTYRNIKKNQDEALRLFSGDGDPNEYLLENYEYYVQKWLNQALALRKLVPTVDDAGQLKNEEEIRLFIVAFRNMVRILATLKTFSAFDWGNLEEAIDEDEYEGYKSWYSYYKDQSEKSDPEVPVPVDVDFDIELVRTDRINVVYILNLLKSVHKVDKTPQEREADIDLILRAIESSDNDSLRAKKDIVASFIRTKFYDLGDDADIQVAFEDFARDCEKAEIEEFSREHGIDCAIIYEIMTEYAFYGKIPFHLLRKRLQPYKLKFLELKKRIESIQQFIENTYKKYKAEGR